ncbi:hypothetical protein DPMN_176270 [Dreissena polymorpha]|uniref:Uncharacterized protein n=1 Tax=Dreissena polymorpha TaxID=45954 RepID=A0A9D4IGR9_DREPO|nr:hypothetical protein DPMN_176270 [Dreissena polymorpha]
MYCIMNCSNPSWHCLQCGKPNFASSLFDSTVLTPTTTTNSFSVLSFDSPDTPTASSSPKPCTQASQTIKTKHVYHPIKVVSLNFQ